MLSVMLPPQLRLKPDSTAPSAPDAEAVSADEVFDAIRRAGGYIERSATALYVRGLSNPVLAALRPRIRQHRDALLAIAPFAPMPATRAALRLVLEETYRASEAAPDDDVLHRQFIALLREYERRERMRADEVE